MGIAFLVVMMPSYKILFHPERGESCAKILARGRHGRYGIACSITFWREGQAATRSLADGQTVRPGTLKITGAVFRATAVEAASKGSSMTAEQIHKATALATAKPMARNTYKLDLARGLMVRTFQQVA